MNSQINNDAPFKVGCRYLMRNGAIAKLSYEVDDGWVGGRDSDGGCRTWKAATGRWSPTGLEYDLDLLPGEVDEAGKPVNQSAGDDGWIEWKGGECPVSDGVPWEVRLRNGQQLSAACLRSELDWHHMQGDEDFDIVAYKLAPQEPAKLEVVAVGVEDLNARLKALTEKGVGYKAREAAERTHPPLTWNKPGPSFADKQFPGYVVTRSGPDDLDAWFSQGKP